MHEKKEPELHHVHVAVCHEVRPEEVAVEVQNVESAEREELWSVVGKKSQPRWLWPARAPIHGIVLAKVCGTREAEVF
jgi:insertion element IS1 protein InsB